MIRPLSAFQLRYYIGPTKVSSTTEGKGCPCPHTRLCCPKYGKQEENTLITASRCRGGGNCNTLSDYGDRSQSSTRRDFWIRESGKRVMLRKKGNWGRTEQ